MHVITDWTAVENRELAKLEDTFLKKLKDDDIRVAYLAARKGDRKAFHALASMANDDWQTTHTLPQRVEANTAVAILRWFQMGTP